MRVRILRNSTRDGIGHEAPQPGGSPRSKVLELGLDADALDLSSAEATAGALRRLASSFCPCTASALVRGAVRPLTGLVDDLQSAKLTVEQTLEAMIAHGDLLELRDVEDESGHGVATLLYAAPPSFVVRESGVVMLVGVASDRLSPLSEDLEARIEHSSHHRRLNPRVGERLREALLECGLIELSHERWLRTPPSETPAQHLSRVDSLLDAAPPSRDVPGLVILDSRQPVRYYPGRWTAIRSHSGRFVARRRQAYGADLWSYVHLHRGNPERLIDLPIHRSRWRACDEAWHLQMAIDAQRGEPQRFRLGSAAQGNFVLDLFSPVPMWARRRWDAIGEPVTRAGSLFSYRFSAIEIEEELEFARGRLWMSDVPSSPEGTATRL